MRKTIRIVRWVLGVIALVTGLVVLWMRVSPETLPAFEMPPTKAPVLSAAVQQKIAAARLEAGRFLRLKPSELACKLEIMRFADGGLHVHFESTDHPLISCWVWVDREGGCQISAADWRLPQQAGTKQISREEAVAIARRFLKEKGVGLKERGLPDEPKVDAFEWAKDDWRDDVSWHAPLNMPGMEGVPLFKSVTVNVARGNGLVEGCAFGQSRPARVYRARVDRDRAIEIARKRLGRKTSELATLLMADMSLYDRASWDPELDGQQWLVWHVGFEIGCPPNGPKWPPFKTEVMIDAENGKVMGKFP